MGATYISELNGDKHDEACDGDGCASCQSYDFSWNWQEQIDDEVTVEGHQRHLGHPPTLVVASLGLLVHLDKYVDALWPVKSINLERIFPYM